MDTGVFGFIFSTFEHNGKDMAGIYGFLRGPYFSSLGGNLWAFYGVLSLLCRGVDAVPGCFPCLFPYHRGNDLWDFWKMAAGDFKESLSEICLFPVLGIRYCVCGDDP